jgi:hypothetical protein
MNGPTVMLNSICSKGHHLKRTLKNTIKKNPEIYTEMYMYTIEKKYKTYRHVHINHKFTYQQCISKTSTYCKCTWLLFFIYEAFAGEIFSSEGSNLL